MKLMRLALVGLLAISINVYADGGKKHTPKAKAKAKTECPSNCLRTGCSKTECAKSDKTCAQMTTCGQKK